MINKEINTEQLILEAAEAEFLEKGYANATTTAIAHRAGISHSMLHYYFRTKENLFQMIFRQKIQLVSQLFEGIDEKRLPFTDAVRLFMECQFNIIRQSPKLPHFILHEIVTNKENLHLALEVVQPKSTEIFDKMEKMLAKEIRKGAVRPVKFLDFIMNIIAINVSTFFFLTVMENMFPDMDKKMKETYLDKRKESNIQFIINSLRP